MLVVFPLFVGFEACVVFGFCVWLVLFDWWISLPPLFWGFDCCVVGCCLCLLIVYECFVLLFGCFVCRCLLD